MASPVWKTTAGLIEQINEREFYSYQLEAEDADSTALTYSKIAGQLPPGIELTTAGELRGVPFEVATRSLYTFVVRVSDGTNIADRTFSMQVLGADAPTFTTTEGQLDMSDSTFPYTWVLDGSYIQYQIEAVDTDTASGQTLVYDISSGRLPPGVTMSTSGLISGVVQLARDDRYGDIGGYDNTYAYDDTPYDPMVYSKSRSVNYEFTVRVTDGVSEAEQINSIFVYTADFWRVDNDRITVDMSEYETFPLLMSLSANRRPIFETDSNLGVFRHNNRVVIKIDVVDFDPLQSSIEYSIIDGALPTGTSIDINSGAITGELYQQAAVETEYSFTIRASRTPISGVTVYTDKTFTMTVIGDMDVGIAFVTPSNLGTILPGIPCLLKVEAEAVEENRILSYSITSGSLPTGLTLSPQGNIIGTINIKDFTTFDLNDITFDSNTTSFDRLHTFTVNVSDQYQTNASNREFTITVSLPYNKEYGSLSARGLLSNVRNSASDSELFYEVAQDPNINNTSLIFRVDDPSFGVRATPEMLLVAGFESQTLLTIQSAMEQNHEPKILYFGDIKTARAIKNNQVVYEVVYIEMKDNLVNKSGTAISRVLNLRSDINRPMLGTLASDTYTSADYNIYNVTTDGGLSFSIAGSKLRYANPFTADIGTFEKLYPNAIEHMRTVMKDLGHKEFEHLPLWMRSAQTDAGAPLGYVPAVVLAYTLPGKSGLVRKRILDKNIDFKKIFFRMDRYIVNGSFIETDGITPDGSTTDFTLNEIVHEEEIVIKQDENTLTYGNQITADNDEIPTYLSADTLLRSADYEPGFSLTHDAIINATTINFTNAPPSTAKIRVERNGDKYLAFKRKIKE